MPEVSRFYGIIVRLYYNDHNPPHLHAEYAGREVRLNIRDLSVITGRISPRALGLLIEWATLHQNELLENWARAQAQKPIQKIEPLA